MAKKEVPCEVCQELNARKGVEPPCWECKPEVLDANYDAVKVYQSVQTQVIMSGMGDVIDLNIVAVKIIMDLYKIRNQVVCLEKVLYLSRKVNEESKLSGDKIGE